MQYALESGTHPFESKALQVQKLNRTLLLDKINHIYIYPQVYMKNIVQASLFEENVCVYAEKSPFPPSSSTCNQLEDKVKRKANKVVLFIRSP